ncbi:MAG TPA: IS3 family transposase [Acidimicrobiales bacterium]|nr:IS3 family transposase [Acidimicrobiales bacterium]
MTVSGFIAAQRTDHGVSNTVACRALGVSTSWFYKWHDRPATARQRRRAALDEAVKRSFDESEATYGSPRVLDDLREWGWRVSKKTVEASMVRQELVARSTRRKRRSLTKQDKTAPKIIDLIKREFDATVINEKWCGDLTEIPTDEGKLYLATVEDLASRRLPGFAIGEHHDAELAAGAIKMAAAVRGGDVRGVIFHSDRGSEYSAGLFRGVCERLGITQSMGRVGSALDNAAAESFFSTLEFELLRKKHFATKADARREVARFIDRYNTTRRHSACERKSPIDYEAILAARAAGTIPDAQAA